MTNKAITKADNRGIIEQIESNRFAPDLDAEQKLMIQSNVGVIIREMDKKTFAKEIIDLIIDTHLQKGQKPDTQFIEQTLPALCKDMLDYFGLFTMEQVKLAFKMGIMGAYGETFGLNNSTYLHWLKQHLGNPKRIQANRRQKTFEMGKDVQPVRKLTPEEQKKANKLSYENIKGYYEQHGKPPALADWSNAYAYMEEVEILSYSKDEKNIFRNCNG